MWPSNELLENECDNKSSRKMTNQNVEPHHHQPLFPELVNSAKTIRVWNHITWGSFGLLELILGFVGDTADQMTRAATWSRGKRLAQVSS